MYVKEDWTEITELTPFSKLAQYKDSIKTYIH